MNSTIRNSIKKFVKYLFHVPIEGESEQVSCAWQEITRFLIVRYWTLLCLFLVSGIAAIFEGATMAMLGLAVSVFVSGEIPFIDSLPQVFANPLMDWLLGVDKTSIFLGLVVSAVLAQILKSGLLYVSELIQIWLAYSMKIHLQQLITNRIMQMSYSKVSKYPAGKLANFIDQAKLVLDVTVQLGTIVRATLMGVAYLVVMLMMSFSLTIASMVAIVVLWYSLRGIVRWVRSLSKDATQAEIEVWRWTVEYLNAPRVLRIFNSTKRAERAINKVWLNHLLPERKADLVSAAIPKILEIVTVTGAGIFLVGTLLFSAGNKEYLISTIFVYVLIFFRLRPIIKAYNDLRIKVARIVPRLEVVGGILIDRDDHQTMVPAIEFKLFSKEIRFESVSFRYPETERLVLNDIDLSIPRGATTAIVGTSGAGKSTIADLLLGLYEPTSGAIYVDAIDLKDLNIAQWRSAIGVVEQEVFLLNTTISENIGFGRPGASMLEIRQAAEVAYAAEFIHHLSQGYNTVVGDRGFKLSGGQQQRLALARAVLSRPDILILDEATSSLDTISERLIQNAIEDMHHKRTIVGIAHRLSTIANADRIVVIENGRIIEEGSKKELLSRNGQFARMWNTQADQADS